MEKFIPLSVPNLKGNELNYVTSAVSDEWVSTGGEYINRFEKDIADYLKVSEAVACQSGTAALHLSLILSGIKAGDEVITPTLTFIAAVNPIRYMGAEPVFMDCDDSLTIDTLKLKEFCEEKCDFVDGKLINKASKKHIKAIIVVHIFGNMADMESIMEIAEKYNIKVIEDATEALGSYYLKGKYKDKYAGTIGDFGAYSFNGNKIITTGGGGMLVSNLENGCKKAKYLSTQAKDDELNYIHNEVGYNYRMTNLQAALGVAQLEKIEDFIKIKEENYLLYKKLFKNNSKVKLLNFSDEIRSNKWFYSLFINEGDIGKIIRELQSHKIQTRPIWGLIHEQQPYINNFTYNIEKAKHYSEHIINIPCSTNLNAEDVKRVVEIISIVIGG
ncbi:LegC family aminotransferase [Clostridium sp. 'White wine YQ']|uniref:LegC family aminotransferase n=1 Tax=Clostridium sp. 'White wine YQ' TaxID=3027474 RepID=UPI00236573B0|nr:LegC family aminotransferase [Clostridium sp. 'White wine YQ']MDD7794615.1 LegC family aminotransferase [Clostridium sp. 'White wine YQ']